MAKRGRPFVFGFRAGKNGKPPERAIIIIRPRNAYELLGLRRPAPLGKA